MFKPILVFQKPEENDPKPLLSQESALQHSVSATRVSSKAVVNLTQEDDLQKQDNGGSEKLPVSPLVFSSAQSCVTSSIPDQSAVGVFLKLVAEGEQDRAEDLLRDSPDLALASADVTDLSERTFKNITGFQYAVCTGCTQNIVSSRLAMI